MIGLLRSEMLRLFSRRLFRWLVALSMLGIAIGGIVFLARGTDPARFVTMQSNLEAIGFPLVMLAWLIGASAIGAEWQPRMVSALLTWEPRRLRVLSAKVLALSVFVVAVVFLLAVFFTAALAPASATRGTFAGADAAWWRGYLEIAARIAAVAVLASWIGFGLATIGRHTAAALGGGFVYLFVAEPMLTAWKPHWAEWMLGLNMGRVVLGGESFNISERSTMGAGGVVALWAGVILLVGAWLFRRREMG